MIHVYFYTAYTASEVISESKVINQHTHAAHTLLLIIIGIIVSLLKLVNFAIPRRRTRKGTSAFVCVCLCVCVPFSISLSLASNLLHTLFHYLISSCDIILFLIVRINKYMHIVSQLDCVLSARGAIERKKNKRKRERAKNQLVGFSTESR